jgi:hypothetical protein
MTMIPARLALRCIPVIAVGFLLSLLIGTSGAAPAATPHVRAPHFVHPGGDLALRAKGFLSHKSLHVDVWPAFAHQHKNVVTRPEPRFWRTDDHGRARLTFRFPKMYFVCDKSHQCKRKRWARGMRAEVKASAFSSKHQFARTVVRVIRRHKGWDKAVPTGSSN